MANSQENRTREVVKAFIRKRIGDIPENARFFRDLGVDGLDAETFMEDFTEKFKVDMSAFNPDEYYTQEGYLLNWPRVMFLALFNRKKLPHKVFTIDHLCKVVVDGKWSDPSMPI